VCVCFNQYGTIGARASAKKTLWSTESGKPSSRYFNLRAQRASVRSPFVPCAFITRGDMHEIDLMFNAAECRVSTG
jgi:type II secretory pathway component PulK